MTVLSVDDFLVARRATVDFSAILTSEVSLLAKCLESLHVQQRALISDKALVAEQSGDNWHDGAFNATDSAARTVSAQAEHLHKLLKLPRLTPPDPREPRVTVGSLVTFTQGSQVSKLLLVGSVNIYVDDLGHNLCSVGSPISQALIGLISGDTSSFRGEVLRIIQVDQGSLKTLLDHNLAAMA